MRETYRLREGGGGQGGPIRWYKDLKISPNEFIGVPIHSFSRLHCSKVTVVDYYAFIFT